MHVVTRVAHLEVIAEDPSMEAALRALLPMMVGELSFEIYAHQCKEELILRLPDRLRGYAAWIPDAWRILVVLDRDDDDCRKLKAKLERIASDAGLRTRSSAGRGPWSVVNRIAIEELEAWFFGDWAAVRAAYPRVPATIPAKRKFRNVEAIPGGTWEALERILMESGYYRNGLPKIEAARRIAANMVPDRNLAASFRALRDVLTELTGE